MISLVNGAAAARTISSLRAACEMLEAAHGRVNAVSVSGVLPDADDPTLPVLTVAQRLAAEHGLGITVDVDGDRFVVQFRRVPRANGSQIPEAG
jgi:hypothetical protein